MDKIILSVAIAGFLFVASCKDVRDDSCFDPALVEAMKDSVCVTGCEGVCACNNRTYCNECEAMKAGYRVNIGDSIPCNQ
jgi:hypothetical protein